MARENELLKKVKKTAKPVTETKVFKEKGAVFLEGFANRAVVDRAGDIIPGDAWELDNFEKNPVVLVNHGMDPKLGGLPVGRVIGLEKTEEGLKAKLRISNSKTEDITRVRDLVEEGILTAMSVGFDPKGSEEKNEDGNNIIKSAELFEISLVGVPMNQDSTGTASAKSILDYDKKELKQMKGFHQDKRDDKKDEEEDEKRKPKKPMKQAEDEEELGDHVHEDPEGGLTGPEIDLPNGMHIHKRPEGRGLTNPTMETEDHMHTVDADDDVTTGPRIGVEDLRDKDEEEENSENDENEDAEERESDAEQSKGELLASRLRELIDKETSENRTRADIIGDMADAAQITVAEVNEIIGGNDELVTEEVIEGFSEILDITEERLMELFEVDRGELRSRKQINDFQDCVRNKIPILIDEGMERDQAVAVAISQCREKESCDINVSKEMYSQFFDLADNHGKEEKQADQDIEKLPTTAIDNEPAPDDFGSPHIDLMKQTNILLGSLIAEVQKLRSQVEQLKISDEPEASNGSQNNETSATMNSESSDQDRIDESKAIEATKNYLDSLAKRLKRLDTTFTD